MDNTTENPAPVPDATPAVPAPSAAPVKKRILIIDDEVSFARMLKMNLEKSCAFEVRVDTDFNATAPVADESGRESSGRREWTCAPSSRTPRDRSFPDRNSLAEKWTHDQGCSRWPVVFCVPTKKKNRASGRRRG